MLGPRLPPARVAWLSLVGSAGFLLVWSAAAVSGITSRDFLPAPWDVVARFAQLVVEPFAGYTLFEHLLSSFQRFATGFAIAVLLGIPLGLLMAWFPWVDRLVAPGSAAATAGAVAVAPLPGTQCQVDHAAGLGLGDIKAGWFTSAVHGRY